MPGQLDKPLAAFIRLYKPAYFQRVGLRYVNIFSRARLGLEGARWAELFSPAYTAPMQEAELPEDRFLNCACDLTLKLDSSCQAKVHAGPGVVKRNAPGVPQDPEVKFIFDMDLSMTGNTPCTLAAGALETLTATPPACLKVLSPTGSGTPWRPDNLRKSPGDVYGRLRAFCTCCHFWNMGVERYRSPLSGSRATMVLPAFSGCRASWAAAHTAAPEVMPTRMPSVRASSRPVA